MQILYIWKQRRQLFYSYTKKGQVTISKHEAAENLEKQAEAKGRPRLRKAARMII